MIERFPDSKERTLSDAVDLLRGAHRTAWDWGCVGDGLLFLSGSITAGTSILTIADSGLTFKPTDIGKLVYIQGAGPSSGRFVSTIKTYTSSTSVVLNNNAASTVVSGIGLYGTDNTYAIREAVADIVSTRRRGGRLHFPRGCYLTSDEIDLTSCRAGFRISGESWCSVSKYGQADWDNASTVWCVAAKPVFKIAGTSYSNQGWCLNVDRITLSGVPYSGSMGLKLTYGSDAHLEHVMFDVFGDHAVKVETCINFTADHCIAQNSMMVHTGRTNYVGVFDIDATDCFISRCNVNSDFNIASDTPSVSGYIAALVIRTANGWIDRCMLAQAEVGLVALNAAPLKLSGVRCDINRRHGFLIKSSQVQANNCLAFRNSRDADGQYSGFKIEEGQNTFTDCLVVNLDQDNPGHASPFTPARRHKYGFEDTGDFGASLDLHNKYVNCRAIETSTGKTFKFTGATNKFLGIEYQPSGSEQEPDTTARVMRYDSANKLFGLLQSTTVPYAAIHVERTDAADCFRAESPLAPQMWLSTAAPANKRIWKRYINAGVGYSELIESIANDAQSFAANWLKVVQDTTSGADSPTITEVVSPAPFHGESTGRFDGVVTLRIGTSGAQQIFTMHGSGISFWVCTDDPNIEIPTAVAGSVAMHAGGNVFWQRLDNDTWLPHYPGKELPDTAPAGRLLISSGGTPAAWGAGIVNLSNPASVSISGAASSEILINESGVVGGLTYAQVAAAIREFIVPVTQAEVTGLTGRLSTIESDIATLEAGLSAALEDIADLVGALASKADISHGHSGTTGSGGTPAHDHSISL